MYYLNWRAFVASFGVYASQNRHAGPGLPSRVYDQHHYQDYLTCVGLQEISKSDDVNLSLDIQSYCQSIIETREKNGLAFHEILVV